jgi:hypothetical protein
MAKAVAVSTDAPPMEVYLYDDRCDAPGCFRRCTEYIQSDTPARMSWRRCGHGDCVWTRRPVDPAAVEPIRLDIPAGMIGLPFPGEFPLREFRQDRPPIPSQLGNVVASILDPRAIVNPLLTYQWSALGARYARDRPTAADQILLNTSDAILMLARVDDAGRRHLAARCVTDAERALTRIEARYRDLAGPRDRLEVYAARFRVSELKRHFM